MANMIVTGGYGSGGASSNTYADIVWRKDSYVLTFRIDVVVLNAYLIKTAELYIEKTQKTIMFDALKSTDVNFNTSVVDLRFTI